MKVIFCIVIMYLPHPCVYYFTNTYLWEIEENQASLWHRQCQGLNALYTVPPSCFLSTISFCHHWDFTAPALFFQIETEGESKIPQHP